MDVAQVAAIVRRSLPGDLIDKIELGLPLYNDFKWTVLLYHNVWYIGEVVLAEDGRVVYDLSTSHSELRRKVYG